ncbi:MAG: penicillin-binding protein 2 [Candidatus Omnitrophica bacterium]|nr:penicillin-binding protein 2 [Candidatus Omnitrophota bacterium]
MSRIKIVNLLIICTFLFLGLSIVNLQIIQGKKFKTLSDKNCIRIMSQEGCRGKIFDREGLPIVDNELSYDLMLLPQDKREFDKVLLAVSKVLGTTQKNLKDTLKKSFVASSLPVAIAKNIDLKKAIALEELKSDFPNIIIQPRPIRHYPYGSLASHVIGYLSEIDHWRLTKLQDYGYNTKDIVGFGGIEEKYDYYLRQDEGGLLFEVDHRGKFIRVLGFRAPHNGKNMQLTLSLKAQKIVEQCLADKKGAVILMDPYSGEIIAMASFPNFNPSVFTGKLTPSITNLFNNPDAPLINRAISGTYPAGSIFKLIVATAGLETGKINSSTTFLCRGSIFVGKQEFACWDTHNYQDIIAAIAHSCNVFFYKSGLLLGAQTIHDFSLRFNLSKPIPFELPYEASGFVPSPLWKKIYKFKNWFDGDTVNFSIGQGDLLVTPLQMARVTAVFANSGYLVTPYLVKGLDQRDISNHQRKIVNLHLKPRTLNYISQGLRNAVLDPKGTGHVLSGLSISVAGKTGTAQVSHGQPHSWFTGFFPYKNPKYVICVFLENGGPGYYACVVAKQIIEQMANEGLI